MNEEQMTGTAIPGAADRDGGVEVYETALRCVQNEDLKEEWEEYLEQTEHHVEIVQEVFAKLGLDPETETPGRAVVRHIGESLVKAMEMALESGPPEAAEIVAAECVVLAETKDHLNWELIGMLAGKAKGETAQALREAYKEVEDQEDEHLYHTPGLESRAVDPVRSACRPCCRRPRRRRTSRRRSGRPGQSRSAAG